MEGEDPLAPFGPNAARHVKRTDGFPHCPDLVVNSTYWPETDEVAAFEELVGSHGGHGRRPVATRSRWCPPNGRRRASPVVGAEAMHAPLPPLAGRARPRRLPGRGRALMRARLRWRGRQAERPRTEDEYIEVDPAELTGVFAAPQWLRDVGSTAWLLVGVALFLVGSVWLLSLTETIVVPVIAAGVIAAVAAPVVDWLQRHHVPRPVGAILLLLALVALGALVVVIVIGGITSQFDDLGSHLDDAKNTLAGWLEDVGVDPDKARQAQGRRELGASECRERAAPRRRDRHLRSSRRSSSSSP